MKETSLVKQHIIYTLYFYYMINILSNYYIRTYLLENRFISSYIEKKKSKNEDLCFPLKVLALCPPPSRARLQALVKWH